MHIIYGIDYEAVSILFWQWKGVLSHTADVKMSKRIKLVKIYKSLANYNIKILDLKESNKVFDMKIWTIYDQIKWYSNSHWQSGMIFWLFTSSLFI